MVETITKSKNGNLEANRPEVSEFAQLGRILLESIPSDRKQQWAGKVMAYLAEKTMQYASGDDAPLKMSTKVIHADLGGNPNQEPSAWLSPLWKDIDRRYYPEIEATLIERCRELGLDVYPIIAKGDGKPVNYWLSSKKIPVSGPDREAKASPANTPPAAILYKKDLNLQLSLAGRIFFGEGMKWTPLKHYSLLISQLLFLVTAMIYLLIVGLVLWYEKGPLSAQHLILLAMGTGVAWWACRHIVGVGQLFEDRIIIAPDWMLAWKEFGATVEITRSKSSEIPMIHVNRYSTTCPVCGWMVKLTKGEPDFPRRLVGRCEENPREHVFSFDRSTKVGWPLRATPHGLEHLPSQETQNSACASGKAGRVVHATGSSGYKM